MFVAAVLFIEIGIGLEGSTKTTIPEIRESSIID